MTVVSSNCGACANCCDVLFFPVDRTGDVFTFALQGCDTLVSWEVVAVEGTLSLGPQGVVVGGSTFNPITDTYSNTTAIDLNLFDLTSLIVFVIKYTDSSGEMCGRFYCPFVLETP